MIAPSTIRPLFVAGIALIATLLGACGDNGGGLLSSTSAPKSDFKPVPVSPINKTFVVRGETRRTRR